MFCLFRIQTGKWLYIINLAQLFAIQNVIMVIVSIKVYLMRVEIGWMICILLYVRIQRVGKQWLTTMSYCLSCLSPAFVLLSSRANCFARRHDQNFLFLCVYVRSFVISLEDSEWIGIFFCIFYPTDIVFLCKYYRIAFDESQLSVIFISFWY